MPLIDRTAKAALDTNLNNGVTSDAPKLKASNDVVYNNQDDNYAEFTTHRDAATLAHPDGSVTTAKLANAAVSTAKIADSAVTTAKIADGSLTAAKFVSGALSNDTQNALNIVALKADTAQMMVNIETYGAKANDSTFDNIAKIQAAIDDVYSKYGGGTVVISDLYYVKPTTSGGIVLKDNVTLDGRGNGKLKVMSTTGDYSIIISLAGTTNACVEGLFIDQNPEENTDTNISVTSNPACAIYMNNANKATIRNNRIHSCGVWAINVEVGPTVPYNDTVRIEGNYIDYVQGVGPVQGGLPPGVLYDNSRIYCDAKNAWIVGNELVATGLNMTAIELHHSGGVARDNIVRGFRTSIIVFPLVFGTDDDASTMMVVDNKLYDTLFGVTLYHYNYKDLENVTVHGNIIHVDPVAFNDDISAGINLALVDADDNTNKIRNVSISKNIITFAADTRTYSDQNSVFNFVGISLSAWVNLDNVDVVGNIIENAPAIGIVVGGRTSGTTHYYADGVHIADNLIIDAGKNENIAGTDPVCRCGIALTGYYKNISVGINTIVDRKSSGTYYVVPLTKSNNGTDSSTVLEQITWNGDVDESNTFKAVTFQNSWVNNGGTSADVQYMKDRSGIVHLRGDCKSGTTTAGTVMFTLPAGYRPGYLGWYVANSNAALGVIRINSNGEVYAWTVDNSLVSFDGVTFKAEN